MCPKIINFVVEPSQSKPDMKKTNIAIWGIAIAALLSIVFFFKGWILPFRILASVFVAIILLFIIGIIASVKDIKKEMGKMPGPMVALVIAAVILVGGGFIFTKNVLDAILLGCAFSTIIGTIFMLFDKQFDVMMKDALKLDSFVIGKVFPWKEYVYPGDHITPDINMSGFDVVASFTDLTEKEAQAFSSSEIKVSVFEYLGLPFIIFNYDDVVRLQFSINIQKMKDWARETWVNDKENGFVCVFLLESNDGTLKGIRHFELKMMPVLKRIISTQLQMTREDIDGLIRVVESQFDVPQMEVMAQYTEIVPRSESEL